MAARDADIKLLIGVATGGPDGDSEQLIRDQLNAIMSKIKVDVTLKTTNFRSQIRKGMSEANKNGKYAVTVSDIKIGANAIKSFKQQLSAVINTLTLDKGVSVTIEHKDIGKATGEVKKLKEQTEEAVREAAELKVRMSALGSSKSAIGSGLKSISKGASADEAAKIAQLQERYRALNVSLEELKINGVKSGDARINSLEEEAAAILKVIDQIKEEQRVRKEADAQSKRDSATASYKSVKDTYSKIDTYLNKNPRIEEKYRVQLESLRKELHGIVVDVDGVDNGVTKLKKQRLTEIIDEFADLDVKITSAGQKGNTFAGMLSAAWQKFGGWMLVTKSLTTAWRTMVRMVDSVRDLDAAMTELKKVTDETSATYARFFDEATVRAKALGATLTDTITATADFARLGYSISEAAELADAALVYKNVGDGIEDVTEASESVISTMKAFGIEAKNAMFIVDKFNEVGNNFAISSQGVGEALRRSASALAAGNNSLDESIALVTAANSVVQDADVVGTTMKTLSMYLRAAKTEAEEAGESTEGMADSVSELRSEILSLTSGRVDIMLDNDTFKSTYQIMKELAAVWDDLTDITRANILEKVAGKRNANVVSSLLENFDVAEDAVKSAADSAGSALAENEKYLDSINGKVAQFQAAFEALSAAFISSDFIKGFVSSGTDALEILTKLVDKLGSFPSLLATITTAVTAFGGMKRNYLGLFDVVDGKVGVSNNAAQWAQRVKDIALYNKAVAQGKEAQDSFVNSLRSTDSAMTGYLKSLNGAKATTAGYKTYCKQAGVEVKTLGVSSKLAAVGVTALNVALNAIASLAIGFVIQGIVSAITHLINADQEAIEKTKELNAAFNEFKQNNSDNISKLESMKEEFKALSVGVSQYGENISLTADEYDRYKQIVQEIVAISPELSEGYSVENGYLADKNELLERAIELQKQEYKEKVHEMADTQNITERMGGYSAFMDSGASTKVKDFMSTALDVSRNAIMSSKDQAISWGDSGIRLRKWANDMKTEYDPKQVWLNNNSILMTSDNWSTAELAIGNFYDENLGDCWGIVAPNIVGTLLAGSNLVIESAKQDGGVAVFKVDAEGCTLHNSNFSITSENTKTQILLDPMHGIMIGKYPLIDNEGTVDDSKKLFYADTNGNLTLKGTIYASAGEFTGKVTATSGYIGTELQGWEIHDDAIYNGKSLFDSSDEGIYIGTNGISLGDGEHYIRASKEGLLTANNVDVTGKVKATSGYIGNGDEGWYIGDKAIYNGKDALSSDETGIYIGVDGISVRNGDKYITLNGYDGSLTANNATITGTINADGGYFKGELQSATGSFSGTVTATAGEIGGCNIEGGTLNISNAKIGTLEVGSANIGSVYADTIIGGTNNQNRYISAGVISDNSHSLSDLHVANIGMAATEDGISYSVTLTATNVSVSLSGAGKTTKSWQDILAGGGGNAVFG